MVSLAGENEIGHNLGLFALIWAITVIITLMEYLSGADYGIWGLISQIIALIGAIWFVALISIGFAKSHKL